MSGNVSLWSKTDITNQSIDPAVNFAEGQTPGTVNNSARAVMSGVAAWRDDLNGTLTTGGSANVQTVTTNTAYAALATGLVIGFKAGFTNTAAATLTVTGASAFAAKALRKITSGGDVALNAGDIKAAGHYIVRYDAAANGASGAWVVLNPVVPVYEAGTWTPADASSDSVALTSTGGLYTKIERLVSITGAGTYASTAGTQNAVIGGLPFTCTATLGGIEGKINYHTGSTAKYWLLLGNNAKGGFYDGVTGNFISNAQMTLKVINISANYTV